jgi:2-haloacid dehalogenase
VLAAHELDPDAAENIVDALAEVPAYPDARPALDRLAEADVPAVVLTNGGAKQTKQLLERAGLDDRISRVFTTEEAKAYKPDPRPYRRVCEQLDLEPSQAVLVAAHGWDVAGALAAGYDAVWVDRLERCWPLPTDEPARRARDLVEAVSATG